MVLFSRLVFNILCIATMLSTVNAVASDDAYLKMLEGEAEDVKLDQRGQLKDKETDDTKGTTQVITNTNWAWEGNLEGDILPPDLAQDELAGLLKQRFYGTFVFYRRLSSIDQQMVYSHYQKISPADLDSIRQEILNLLKN